MPIKLNGETYYWINEACQIAGTSKNTYLRWVKGGKILDVHSRDRRGWRLFSTTDLARLKAEVNKIQSK